MAKKTNAAQVNLFDQLAQTAPTPKSKTSKLQIEISNQLQEDIKEYTSAKAKIKALESVLKNAEDGILNAVTPEHDSAAFAGNFFKSVDLKDLTVTYTDRFSTITDPEVKAALQKLLGANYDKAFETKRTVTVKPDAVKNVELIQKFITAAQKAGLNPADVFEVVDVTVSKDGLDELQYQILTEETIKQFRIRCRQYKASIK